MKNDNYYMTLEDCIEAGEHLEAVDEDGFCNSCGHDDVDDPLDDFGDLDYLMDEAA